MKKLLYLGIILILASCGSNESENAAPNESKSITTNESESAASNESTVNVNGREVSTVKIGNLEVMTEGLGEMDWDEAIKACADLGDGWRLPTQDELNILYQNKDEIGGFVLDYYWSSTEFDNGIASGAWIQYFHAGSQAYDDKNDFNYVRAVRAF